MGEGKTESVRPPGETTERDPEWNQLGDARRRKGAEKKVLQNQGVVANKGKRKASDDHLYVKTRSQEEEIKRENKTIAKKNLV